MFHQHSLIEDILRRDVKKLFRAWGHSLGDVVSPGVNLFFLTVFPQSLHVKSLFRGLNSPGSPAETVPIPHGWRAADSEYVSLFKLILAML